MYVLPFSDSSFYKPSPNLLLLLLLLFETTTCDWAQGMTIAVKIFIWNWNTMEWILHLFYRILKYLGEMLSFLNSCSWWWSWRPRASIENCQCPLDLLASSFTCHIALLKASGKNTPQTNFHERLMKTSFRSFLSLLHEVYCHLFSWSWRKRYLLSGPPIFESDFQSFTSFD